MYLILMVLAVSLAVFYIGLREMFLAERDRRRREAAVIPEDFQGRAMRWRALDQQLLRTPWGRELQDSMLMSGIEFGPARLVLATLGFSLVVGLLLGRSLSWLLFPVGLLIGLQTARVLLRRARNRRREVFISQMPELARTLSNATSAGLSIRTALALAVDELADPARSEIRQVSEQINLGASLESALTGLERRLPSREAAILISTLVVSARSGGGLVTALRDIAGTLETRKETRREIRTVYAQTLATAYAVLAMGIAVLFVLDATQEGTVDTMLRDPLGQGALLIAGGIYAGGIVLVRRMTRVGY